MNNAVIYARVSSTTDRQSTERQVNDLNRYANANALNVAKVYQEHISGAKRNDERPVLVECLEYCFANNIDVLLLSELSRLGRNVWEVTENVKRCKEQHLNIYFQKEGFSLFTPDGKESPCAAIMVAVLGTCAQMERENIYFRLKSGFDQYRANGGKVGRKQGSIKTNDDMLNEPKYQEAIKRIKQGRTIREICAFTGLSMGTTQKLKNILKERGLV